MSGDDQPKLRRTAKGKRPQYFADPATDKLLAIVLTLAEELSVTRDRLDAVERLIEQHGLLPAGAVNLYQPGEAARNQREANRACYLERILRVLQMELEEVTGTDMPQSVDEILAQLE